MEDYTMLLRRLPKGKRIGVAIGQTILMLGIFGVVMSSRWSRLGTVDDVWIGLLAGISAVLIGVSIVFNVRSIRDHRCRSEE
jgi:hypothetical protein